MDFRNLELRSFPQAALEIGIGTQAAGMRRRGGELDSDVPNARALVGLSHQAKRKRKRPEYSCTNYSTGVTIEQYRTSLFVSRRLAAHTKPNIGT